MTLRRLVFAAPLLLASAAQADIIELTFAGPISSSNNANLPVGQTATFTLRYEKRYPPTVNTDAEAEFCAKVAAGVVGAQNVVRDHPPSMGSEDFAWMLQKKPGCYIWIGNGGAEGGCLLHNPHYDFNDEILPVGASYWVKLVETALAK